MTAFRIPAPQHVFREAASYLRPVQKRWARVHDVRLLATRQKADDVYEKYREKLSRKAKTIGVKDVHDLKVMYHEEIQRQRKEAVATTTRTPALSSLPLSQSLPARQALGEPIASSTKSSSIKPSGPPGIKPLSSYIDIEKTLQLPEKEIEYIWRLRHASNPHSLCAVVPKSTYDRIRDTAALHPRFILPLPREGQGAEIHFLEWTFPSPTMAVVLFTQFAEFKLRGEYSQPHTTVTHHLDLVDPKGLVLLQGSVVEGKGITADESKWLLLCLQKFYGTGQGNDTRRKLLEQFTRGDSRFRVEELLEEAEKIF